MKMKVQLENPTEIQYAVCSVTMPWDENIWFAIVWEQDIMEVLDCDLWLK